MEKLDVSSAEIDEKIDRVAERMGGQAEKARQTLNTGEYRRELGYSLWTRKVVKFLTDIALSDDSRDEVSEPATASNPSGEATHVAES